jgi:putative Holliday junction resolvase
MARIVGIDYGRRRVGIAVTDSLKIIANALTTVEAKDIFKFLKEYVAKEPVEAFVVGMPVNLNNEDTDATPDVRRFVVQLKKDFPDLPVHLMDERFTSKMALKTLIEAGTTKKFRRDKGNIDKVSAAIFLQEWINHH